MSTTHFRTCNLCEAMCGLAIRHEGRRVLEIRGDPEDPFSRGHLCPKAVALQDLQDDPDRLRRPVRREGREWIEISWDEAYDRVATGIRDVQGRHGPDAVASYLGNPTVHSLGALLFAPPFVKALGSRNRYSATSVDQLPHHFVAQQMFGHALLIPVPDLDRTDHLLIFGADPLVSNGSLMSAGGAVRRLKAIQGRGGRVVVVDPRRTETADLADAHHAIRPGRDALLLLAMLHVVFAEGRERLGRISSFTIGLEPVRELATRFPPARVAAAVGIEASAIETLARDFACAERAAAYGRVGVSMQEFGALSCWLIAVLNAATGRLDAEGGLLFSRPAVDVMGLGGMSTRRFARWRSRVRQLPEFAGELPVATLAEEIETEGPGQIRALVTHGGNPVLSTPNGERLDRALPRLELFAAIDFYINETTRHAHLILPPSGPLERDHYDLVFQLLAVRNGARYSPAMVPREPWGRHDWEILNQLTWRVAGPGLGARLRARARAAVLSRLGPRGLLGLGLRTGSWGAGFNPFSKGLTLGRLESQPHGLDLGPLTPALPDRLRTPDRQVQLCPRLLLDDVTRVEAALQRERPPESLELIGRRQLRSNNSWMHNSERLVRGPRLATLLIHPQDAASRSIRTGDQVEVSSRVGSVRVEAEVSDRVRPGVVSLPHGWGHGREGTRLSVANLKLGASLNSITDDARIDGLVGTAAFSGVPVTVLPTG